MPSVVSIHRLRFLFPPPQKEFWVWWEQHPEIPPDYLLAKVPRAFGVATHTGFLSGRSISSYEGTWVLSDHDSSAAPQTVQTASPVCGTKNFSSVRLYSAPQLH